MITRPRKRASDGTSLPPARTATTNSTNNFLHLNVGGQHYITTQSTLCQEPGSLLATMFADPAANLPTDSNGNYFLDRDGKSFRHILNYLRGYTLCVKPEELHLLSSDVEYYGLERMKPLLGIGVPEDWRFSDGPGVSADRLRFRSAFVVSLLGDDWVHQGVVQQSFRVERAEYVGIGVVSKHCTDQGQEFHKTPQCAVYYMSGVLYHNYPTHTKLETTEPYSDGDIITVVLDMTLRELTWKRNDHTITTIAVEGATEQRLAVVIKRNSVVHIVVPPLQQHQQNPNASFGHHSNTNNNSAAVFPTTATMTPTHPPPPPPFVNN
eukprot:PhF_6_TR20016/c0_g1_i2/m.29235